MIKEAENWLKKAERDLISAKKNLEIKEYNVASFLCQQSVEKALKSFLINKNKEMPKIHDLVRLGKLVDLDKKLLDGCEKLNPVYTESRYPDISERDYKMDETKKDIETAEEILKWVKNKL